MEKKKRICCVKTGIALFKTISGWKHCSTPTDNSKQNCFWCWTKDGVVDAAADAAVVTVVTVSIFFSLVCRAHAVQQSGFLSSQRIMDIVYHLGDNHVFLYTLAPCTDVECVWLAEAHKTRKNAESPPAQSAFNVWGWKFNYFRNPPTQAVYVLLTNT